MKHDVECSHTGRFEAFSGKADLKSLAQVEGSFGCANTRCENFLARSSTCVLKLFVRLRSNREPLSADPVYRAFRHGRQNAVGRIVHRDAIDCHGQDAVRLPNFDSLVCHLLPREV